MIANFIYISHESRTFTNQSGESIPYTKVVVIEDGTSQPVSLSAASELDFTVIKQFSKISCNISFSQSRNGGVSVKITSLL